MHCIYRALNLQKIHCFRLAIKELSPSILDALYEHRPIAIVHLSPHCHIHYNGRAPHTNVTPVCSQLQIKVCHEYIETTIITVVVIRNYDSYRVSLGQTQLTK